MREGIGVQLRQLLGEAAADASEGEAAQRSGVDGGFGGVDGALVA